MNPDESLRWEDCDGYLETYRRRKEERQQWAGVPRIVSNEELRAPILYRDAYADAAKERLSRSAGEPGAFALVAEDAHKDYTRRQRDAQQICRMAEKLGEPVDEETRLLAETPSAHLAVMDFLAKQAENRRQALRQASTPPVRRHDGSTVEAITDPWGMALAGEAALNAQRQIRQHRLMAEGKSKR